MDGSDGQIGALSGSGWSKEELEEMLWLYRTDDSTPWNIAILVLSFVVLFLNIFLLRRSNMANRNQKNSQDKEAVEVRTPFEKVINEKETVIMKDDNSLNTLKETLLSENQNPEQAMIELKERTDIGTSPESTEAKI